MPANKLTPGSNLRWESMRIMLPEHVEALRQHDRQQQRKPRPQLDPQYIEEMFRVIQDAHRQRKSVRVTEYGEYGDWEYRGVITDVDPALQRIMIAYDERKTHVSFGDILAVE